MTTAKKAPFLNTTYSGYFHTELPNVDEELTRVGPGTPCGEWFRRFWNPVAFSKELQDLPLRIRILGEDLILFRDKSGQVGCLELHCSHRGTSLEFGLIEENGIRCCYHGWLFAVDGKILDTPGEPPDSTYKERLCHGAYATHEWNDLVWAYMGPTDKKPPFRMYDTFDLPGYNLVIDRREILPCNWLQVAENGMDPIHTSFLHTRSTVGQFLNTNGEPTMEFGELGELEFMDTPQGIVYVNTRRAEEQVWVRMGEMLPPAIQQTPGHPIFPLEFEDGKKEICFAPRVTKWIVPVDDTNTIHFVSFRLRNSESTMSLNKGQTRAIPDPKKGLTGYQKTNRSYEDQQRNPGDYEAETGQRPIAIHALEHLGNSDRGIIKYRQMVRQGIKAVQKDMDPKGLNRTAQGFIPSYGNDTILLIPPAVSPEEESKLLKETGRRVAKGHIDSPPVTNGNAKYVKQEDIGQI
jgi:phenylpropionate dioxygenase-like ring-hydroxylating dioxygenase large terminal subunit